MNVHILLPAFNEAQALPTLLIRLSQYQATRSLRLKVLIVDDGSDDSTLEIAVRGVPGLETGVISHVSNQGLGQAVLTGLVSILNRAADDDVVVVMDADDTHDPALIDSFIERVLAGSDLVIGSRFVGDGDDSTVPRVRRLLSRCASLLVRLFVPVGGVADVSSGYRAYRVASLRKAYQQWGDRLIVERSFACMTELLIKLRHYAPTIEEVPLGLRYDRKAGPSKMRLLPTLSQYVRMTIRDRIGPPPRSVAAREIKPQRTPSTGPPR